MVYGTRMSSRRCTIESCARPLAIVMTSLRPKAVLLEDVEIVVVAYGSTSWPALEAVYQAREKGIRMGLLRLITVWSVPDREMAAAAENASTVLSIEMNVSKYYSEVERYVEGRCPVKRVTKSRGGIHNAEDVLAAIERVTR